MHRNDDDPVFARKGNGTGDTPPEQYQARIDAPAARTLCCRPCCRSLRNDPHAYMQAFHPGNPNETKPILPGMKTYLRNSKTGGFARSAPWLARAGI